MHMHISFHLYSKSNRCIFATSILDEQTLLFTLIVFQIKNSLKIQQFFNQLSLIVVTFKLIIRSTFTYSLNIDNR